MLGLPTDPSMNADVIYQKLWLAAKVIESTLEGIFVVDKKGLIEIVNPAFTALMGYTAEEVIGKKPHMLAPDTTKESMETIGQAVHTKGAWAGETIFRHK